jgi:hypothetical protein
MEAKSKPHKRDFQVVSLERDKWGFAYGEAEGRQEKEQERVEPQERKGIASDHSFFKLFFLTQMIIKRKSDNGLCTL